MLREYVNMKIIDTLDTVLNKNEIERTMLEALAEDKDISAIVNTLENLRKIKETGVTHDYPNRLKRVFNGRFSLEFFVNPSVKLKAQFNLDEDNLTMVLESLEAKQ